VRLPRSITCLLDRFPFALLRVTATAKAAWPRSPACLPVAGGVRHPLSVPTIAEILEVQAAWAAAGACSAQVQSLPTTQV